MDEFYTVEQAATKSGRSVSGIKYAIGRGYLKATRIGQRAFVINPSDLLTWLNNPDAHKPGQKSKTGLSEADSGGQDEKQ